MPPQNLLHIALFMAMGGAIYLALFVGVAIGAHDRADYWKRLTALIAAHRRSGPAVVRT